MRRSLPWVVSVLAGCFNPDDSGAATQTDGSSTSGTGVDPSTGSPTSTTATTGGPSSGVTSSTTDPDTGTADTSTGSGPCAGFVCGEVQGVDCGQCQIGDCIDNVVCCTAPSEAIVIDTPGDARGVSVTGDEMYVADQAEGLREFDISNLGAPVEIGNLTLGSLAWDVVAEFGAHAYVAWEGSGLVVVDISEPGSIVDVGFEANVTPFAVGIAGTFVYTAQGSDGEMSVIDVVEPTAPMVLGNASIGNVSLDVAVASDHAYFPTDQGEVVVIDVSDPASPAEVARFDGAGETNGVAIVDDVLYVSERGYGVEIVDISDPANPTLLGEHMVAGSAGDIEGIAASGTQVVIANGPRTLFVEVSDPSGPVALGSVDVPAGGRSQTATIFGNNAYVAAGTAGVQVIEMPECAGGA